MKTEGSPLPWEKFPYHGVYTLPPGITEWVFPSAFRVVTGEIEILQYKDEAENERSKALEEVKPRRGRPRYRPTWKDGQESRQEEALWPYAECVIAGRQIRSQNIGTVKAMARDKARNRKVNVPVVLHLPGGTERTIVFTPDGKQVAN